MDRRVLLLALLAISPQQVLAQSCPAPGAVLTTTGTTYAVSDPTTGDDTATDPTASPTSTDPTSSDSSSNGSPTIGGLTQDQINQNYDNSVSNAGASTNEAAGINQAAGNNPDANVLLPSVLGDPGDTSTSTPANQVPAGSNQSPGETWTQPVNK